MKYGPHPVRRDAALAIGDVRGRFHTARSSARSVAAAAVHRKLEPVRPAQRRMHLARERLEAATLPPESGARDRDPHDVGRPAHCFRPTHMR